MEWGAGAKIKLNDLRGGQKVEGELEMGAEEEVQTDMGGHAYNVGFKFGDRLMTVELRKNQDKLSMLWG